MIWRSYRRWSLMYFLTTSSSTLPTVSEKYPSAQKLSPHKNSSNAGNSFRITRLVPPFNLCTTSATLSLLTFYQNELSEVEGQLRQMVRQPSHVLTCMQSVPGVGEVVATSFMLELFGPERFHRAEEVASDLGLVPMVRHSGDKAPPGRL